MSTAVSGGGFTSTLNTKSTDAGVSVTQAASATGVSDTPMVESVSTATPSAAPTEKSDDADDSMMFIIIGAAAGVVVIALVSYVMMGTSNKVDPK